MLGGERTFSKVNDWSDPTGKFLGMVQVPEHISVVHGVLGKEHKLRTVMKKQSTYPSLGSVDHE